jgi:hypothetical protein
MLRLVRQRDEPLGDAHPCVTAHRALMPVHEVSELPADVRSKIDPVAGQDEAEKLASGRVGADPERVRLSTIFGQSAFDRQRTSVVMLRVVATASRSRVSM